MSLDIQYYAFNHAKADKEWGEFFNSRIKENINNLKNEEQELIECLKNKNNFDKDEIINNIKILDLEYGITAYADIEKSKIEFFFVEAIMKIFNFSEKNNYPNKEEWIKFFKNIDKQKLNKIFDLVMKQLDWDKETTSSVIIDYLKSIKPLILELKKDKKAIFISRYLGVFDFEPTESEIFMKKRATGIFKKYLSLN
jgi:hypothetical protein